MANKDTNKERLVVVMLVLQQNDAVTTSEILDRLRLRHDIDADRKTIYADIAEINRVVPVWKIYGGRHTKWTMRRPKEYD